MTEVLDTQDPAERKRIILLLALGVPMEVSTDKLKWAVPIPEWLEVLQKKPDPNPYRMYHYFRIKPQ